MLELFGYSKSTDESGIVESATIEVQPETIHIGGESKLSYALHIREGDPVRIRIEYSIDFVKSGGKVSRKKFLLSDKTVAGGSILQNDRIHRWSDLTTRRHYPGLHQIVLFVNGQQVAVTAMLLESSGEI
ncbi:hypothetical protein D3C78_1633800 [compost metagenome]